MTNKTKIAEIKPTSFSRYRTCTSESWVTIKPKIWVISKGKKKNWSYGDHALDLWLYICFTLLFLCTKGLILARKLLGGGGAHSMSLTGLSSTTTTFTTQILPTNIIFRCNCYIALEKLALFNDMKCFARSIFVRYLLKCYAIWLNSDEKHSILWWKDRPLLFLVFGRPPLIPTI